MHDLTALDIRAPIQFGLIISHENGERPKKLFDLFFRSVLQLVGEKDHKCIHRTFVVHRCNPSAVGVFIGKRVS